MAGVPLVMLAFANEEERFLKSLRQECDAISDALRDRKDDRSIALEVQQEAELGRLFDLVARYRDDLVIFHYGGHANGEALDLKAADGSNSPAFARGLAGLLGSLPRLQLVFLNGCATQGQVDDLLAAGVPAVIATSAPVDDSIALDFARQFYGSLGDRNAARSIQFAFDDAKSLVESARGTAISFSTGRGMTVGDAPPPAVGAQLWGLYVATGKEAALAWSLPTAPGGDFVIETAIAGMPGGQIRSPNSGIIERQAQAVGAFDPNFRKRMDLERETSSSGTIAERVVREEITNAWPAPIGEQLRKLFAGGQLGEPRLQLLIDTYDIATRFIAYALLAQLWDLFEARPGQVKLDDSSWQAIDAFNARDAASAANFDHIGLAIELVRALKVNGVRPLMVECEGLEAAFAAPDCSAARAFIAQARQGLINHSLDSAAIDALVQQGDTHVDAALYAMTFVVGYKLATIKQITIDKQRNKNASYLHRRVVLDRVSAGYSDDTYALAQFAANGAVILVKNLDDVSTYINLSPFVIDQNALTGDAGTKVYFMDWYDEASDTLHLSNISEGHDRLEIRAQMPKPFEVSHPPTLALYKEFRAEVARR